MCVTHVDWGTAPDWITAAAAVGGAVVAWLGVSTWRSELIGREKFEIAKRLLRGAFRIEDIIREIRNDWSGTRETDWDALNSAGRELDGAFAEARILWGDAILSLKQELVAKVSQFRFAVKQVAKVESGKVPEEKGNAIYDQYIEIAASQLEVDSFAKELAAIISRIDRFVRPFLR